MPAEFVRHVHSILISHDHRYPEWEIPDLYKLIHQAALGSEHAVTDEAGVRKWLFEELAHLSQGPDEPLLDPISADGRMIRVHLRPFASLSLDPEQLLQAFVRTAGFVHSPREILREYCSVAVDLAREGRLVHNTVQLREYFDRMHAAQFPAVHHSDRYEDVYRPAYRVVAREFLPGDIHGAAS